MVRSIEKLKRQHHMVRPIEKLKRQHQAILALIRQIDNNAGNLSNVRSADAALEDINQLRELLEEHLLVEDDFLYPVLKKRSDQLVRDTANLFAVQFGGIRLAFENYKAKWNSVGEIQRAPNQFRSETKALAGVLQLRIRSEEAELFPLLS